MLTVLLEDPGSAPKPGGSQPSIILPPRDQTSSSGLCEHPHICDIYTHTQIKSVFIKYSNVYMFSHGLVGFKRLSTHEEGLQDLFVK